MSFKYSVIGDNVPENREWLEKVGYKRHFLDREFDPLLHTWVGSEPINIPGYSSLPIDSVWNPDHPEYSQDMIDCRNNTQLFRAVTAMRDDSDYMQLFKCDGGYFISSYNDTNTHIQDYCKGWDMSNLKKMSLSELQEYFKPNELKQL